MRLCKVYGKLLLRFALQLATVLDGLQLIKMCSQKIRQNLKNYKLWTKMEYSPTQILSIRKRATFFWSSKLVWKSVYRRSTFFFRGEIYIYRGDGLTKNAKLINMAQGVFVFIRSSDQQTEKNGRKKRGETTRKTYQPST